MNKVRITESQLKGLVRKMIKEEKGYNYPYFGEEGRKAFNDLTNAYDGPLTDIAIIVRAMELVIKEGPAKVDLYANVLLDALNELKKSGGRIASSEYNGRNF
jgi:hypothetical protein